MATAIFIYTVLKIDSQKPINSEILQVGERLR